MTEHAVAWLTEQAAHCFSLAISDGMVMVNRELSCPPRGSLTDETLPALSLIDLVVLTGQQPVNPLDVSVMGSLSLLLLHFPFTWIAILLALALRA